MAAPLPLVSFIIPFLNSARTLRAALDSVAAQTYAGPLEVCAFDDGSTDGGADVVRAWAAEARARAVRVTLASGAGAGARAPRGPGWARNRAAAAARGEFLCFLDADDEALPRRVAAQLAAARAAPGALVGGRVLRDPPDATPVYAGWANAMSRAELVTHAWRECTLLQPTWFLARATFAALGGYDEAPPRFWAEPAGGGGGSSGGADARPAAEESLRLGAPEDAAEGAADGAAEVAAGGTSAAGAAGAAPADAAEAWRHPPILGRAPLKLLPAAISGGATFETYPEDTLFFHRFLEAAARRNSATDGGGGGGAPAPAPPALVRVDEPVTLYRYSPGSLSWRVPRGTLGAARAALFEERVLAPRGGAGLRGVAIWGAGRDGKAFYNALSPAGRARVAAFFDVDARKIGNVYPVPVSEAKARKRARAAAEGGDAGAGAGAGAIASAGAGDSSAAPPPPPGRPATPPLPIVHFSSADARTRAVVVCVALDAGGDELRANVRAASAAIERAGGAPLVDGENLFFMC
jgi:hypothetical protein